MRYVSVFSGIEAASVAWEPLGWEPAAFCEIDAFPSAVLAERYPDVPNLGDITKVDWGEFIVEHGRPDVLVGGSPCQSFSIAGGRESLGGESRLMFEYIRAVQDLRPRWLLWENVPGVLNTRDNAFVQLLDSLQELGYSLAWRVLDAQFFGVAQGRRRVFLVGHLGDGGACAAVLFESESVRGNTKASREKRQELAASAQRGVGASAFKYHQGARAGNIGFSNEQSPTITADVHVPACLTSCETNRNAVCMASGQANAEINQDGISPTLTLLHEAPIVIDRAAYNQGENAQYPPHIEQTEVMDALVARGPHAVACRG